MSKKSRINTQEIASRFISSIPNEEIENESDFINWIDGLDEIDYFALYDDGHNGGY